MIIYLSIYLLHYLGDKVKASVAQTLLQLIAEGNHDDDGGDGEDGNNDDNYDDHTVDDSH